MDVKQAINSRYTCRYFTEDDVSQEIIKDIFETAVRAPSGGNLQPWHVYILSNETKNNLIIPVVLTAG